MKTQNIKMYVNEKFVVEVTKQEASEIVRGYRSVGISVFQRPDAFNIGNTSKF